MAPKADRDALEAEMDGAGANWQMLDFGGRLHSFAEEVFMMKGRIPEKNSLVSFVHRMRIAAMK